MCAEGHGKSEGKQEEEIKDNAETQRALRFAERPNRDGSDSLWLEKLGIVLAEQLLEGGGGALLQGVNSLD